MSSEQNLYRIEQENSVLFGLKWSFVGFAIALCFLAGCSSIFDSGPQRYNSVEGPRRPPPLNMPNAMGGGQPVPQQPMLYPQMAQQPQPMPQFAPYEQKLENDSWFGGLFDWFGGDDEPVPPSRYYGRPAPQQQAMQHASPHQMPPQAPAVAPYYAPSAAMPPQAPVQHQPIPQPSASPLPQQQAVPAAPAPAPKYTPLPNAHAAPAPVATPQPAAQQPTPHQTQSAGNGQAASIRAQIAELERELAVSETRRNALTQPQVPVVPHQQPQQDDSWLPNLGLDSMFGFDEVSPQQAYAPAPVVPDLQGYKVVKLPPPLPRGTTPTPMSMPPQTADRTPMPPVITAPAYNPMADAPVMNPDQPSIDVPLAPGIGARSVPSNVPSGLLPPDSASRGSGYLDENRYSTRRAYQGFSSY